MFRVLGINNFERWSNKWQARILMQFKAFKKSFQNEKKIFEYEKFDKQNIKKVKYCNKKNCCLASVEKAHFVCWCGHKVLEVDVFIFSSSFFTSNQKVLINSKLLLSYFTNS